MLLVMLLLIAAPVAASAKTTGWSAGARGSAKMSDLIPKPTGEEAYSERYSFAFDLDDHGGHIGLDLTITNLGWGDQHAAEEVRVFLKDQKKYRHKKKYGDGDWSYSKKTFGLNIGKTKVSAIGQDGFRVQHSGKVKFDLVFKNRMPMFKPGGGKITTSDGYYKFNLSAPRADVTGTVTINGQTLKVKGTRAGYADHVATNVAPFDFGKSFSRMRNYNGDVFVMWREIEVAPDHGGERFAWILVGYKDKIVFSDPSAKIRQGKIKVDTKSGYKVPLALQIDAKKGNDSVKLVMRGSRYDRRDLLDSYGDAAKVVASAFTKPVRFDVQCDYQLQMTIGGATATVRGKSHYVIDQLN